MILWTVLILFNRIKLASQKQQGESETERVTVQISRGIVRGFHVNNALLNNFYQGEADVFLGIPYAVPPIGERRFKKSELIGKYEKMIEANKFGDICPQKEEEALPKANDVGISEDCLSLNIYAPNTSNKMIKYPVMVYIYGGALMTGGSEMWMYHGIVSNLVRRGVIWVSFNYRLGFYGFFTTYTEEFHPNRGLWDQITALQWIHEEITNFGGDPNRVTVIGHSAGACSASYLTLSPAVNPGLVSQIIMMSASAEICFEKVFGEFTQSVDRAEQICNINARNGWTDEKVKDMLQCVSALNHSQISAYDAETFRWNAVIDGELFKSFPSEMRWRDIPMLSGSTTEEYAVYEQWKLSSGTMTIEDYKAKGWEKPIKWWLKKIYNEQHTEAIIAEIKREYGLPQEDDGLDHMKYLIRHPYCTPVFKVLSDMIYIHAVGAEAETHIKQGLKNIWLWQIDFHTDYFSFHKIDNYRPVFHSIDLFLLMQPDYAWTDGDQPKKWGDRELQVANEIANEFTHFAKHGHPSKSWKRLNVSQMNYWKIDYYETDEMVHEMKYQNGYGGSHYQFWKNLNLRYRKSFTENMESLPQTKVDRATSLSIIITTVFCVITLYFSSIILKLFATSKKSYQKPVTLDSKSKK